MWQAISLLSRRRCSDCAVSLFRDTTSCCQVASLSPCAGASDLPRTHSSPIALQNQRNNSAAILPTAQSNAMVIQCQAYILEVSLLFAASIFCSSLTSCSRYSFFFRFTSLRLWPRSTSLLGFRILLHSPFSSVNFIFLKGTPSLRDIYSIFPLFNSRPAFASRSKLLQLQDFLSALSLLASPEAGLQWLVGSSGQQCCDALSLSWKVALPVRWGLKFLGTRPSRLTTRSTPVSLWTDLQFPVSQSYRIMNARLSLSYNQLPGPDISLLVLLIIMFLEGMLNEAEASTLGFDGLEELLLGQPLPEHPVQSGLAEEIEAWLKKEEDRPSGPLFIQEHPMAPTKLLLRHWVRKHEEQFRDRNRDVILVNFGKGDHPSNCLSHMFFKVFTQVKELLGLRKKVEIHPEHIRRASSRWLQLMNSQIENLALSEDVEEFRRFIIVLEGLHAMQEDSQAEDLFLWVPRLTPPKVKLIVTFDPAKIDRKALSLYSSLKLKVQLDQFDLAAYASRLLAPRPWASSFPRLVQAISRAAVRHNSSYFLGLAVSLIFPQCDQHTEAISKAIAQQYQPQVIEGLESISSLVKMVLQIWFAAHPETRTVAELLCLVVKGVTAEELRSASGVSPLILGAFLLAIGQYVLRNADLQQEFLMVKSYNFRCALGHIRSSTRLEFKAHVKKLPVTLRRIEQLNNVLTELRQFQQLKQENTRLEQFLILYSPFHKFQLLRMWHLLCVHVGVDVVEQFSKALQIFRSEFLPSDQDFFRIMLQLSRFFKEFAVYEPSQLSFLHPQVICKVDEIHSLYLYDQFVKNKLFPHSEQKELAHHVSLKQLIEQKLNRTKLPRGVDSHREGLKEPRQRQLNWKAKLRCQLEPFKMKNVQNEKERQAFRAGYLGEIKQFLLDLRILLFRLDNKNENVETYEFPPKFDINEEIALAANRNQQLNYYCYRRWVWLNMPWLATSLRDNFSKSMAFFAPSETESVSVADEKMFFLKILSIAASAKQQKQRIMEMKYFDKEKGPNQTLHIGDSARKVALSENKERLSLVSGARNSVVSTIEGLGGFIRFQTKGKSKNGSEISRLLPTVQEVRLPSLQKARKAAFLTQNEQSIDSLLPSRQGPAPNSFRPKRTSGVTKALRECKSEMMLPRLEVHNSFLRRQLDQIVNQNKSISRDIMSERMVPVEEIQDRLERQRKALLLKLGRRLGEMSKQRKATALSELNLERIQKILKICQYNEFYHKEWLKILNQVLSNIKKMIKFEEADIVALLEAKKHRLEEERRLEEQQLRKKLALKKRTEAVVTQRALETKGSKSSKGLSKARRRPKVGRTQPVSKEVSEQLIADPLQTHASLQLQRFRSKFNCKAIQFFQGRVPSLKDKISIGEELRQRFSLLQEELRQTSSRNLELGVDLSLSNHQHASEEQSLGTRQQSSETALHWLQMSDAVERLVGEANSRLMTIRLQLQQGEGVRRSH